MVSTFGKALDIDSGWSKENAFVRLLRDKSGKFLKMLVCEILVLKFHGREANSNFTEDHSV